MDIVMLVLLALAFVGLLSILKVPILWCIVMVLLLALIYLAVRHPHGRKDWQHDLRTSLSFVVTSVLLILMLYVMYIAVGAFRMPPLVTIVMWLSGTIIVLLALLGMFFPEGYRSSGSLISGTEH